MGLIWYTAKNIPHGGEHSSMHTKINGRKVFEVHDLLAFKFVQNIQLYLKIYAKREDYMRFVDVLMNASLMLFIFTRYNIHNML